MRVEWRGSTREYHAVHMRRGTQRVSDDHQGRRRAFLRLGGEDGQRHQGQRDTVGKVQLFRVKKDREMGNLLAGSV